MTCHVPTNQGISGNTKSLELAKIMEPVRLFCGGRRLSDDAGEDPPEDDEVL